MLYFEKKDPKVKKHLKINLLATFYKTFMSLTLLVNDANFPSFKKKCRPVKTLQLLFTNDQFSWAYVVLHKI